MVMALDDEESLQLLSLKAFQQYHPKSEFIDLSEMVVNYAKGIPLVLEALGSLLYSKSREEWECIMDKLKKVPHEKIHPMLRLSYEALDLDEKRIFLNIACFFKGEPKYLIKSLLDSCSYWTDIGMRRLENKSLIIISEGDKVSLHDLIQEMTWKVVLEESGEELEKQRYLWDPKQICEVLEQKTDTNIAVESILLDMSQIKDVEISPTTFSKMRRLRFLKFYMSGNECNVHISKDLEAFPCKLCYLRWDCFPQKALPSSFCPEMLVELHLRHSRIEKLWDGEQDLANLKSIFLCYSKRLTELPNLSRAKNLKHMSLYKCSNLRHVPPSVFSLDSLWHLNLDECKKLQCIQSDVNSQSLKCLYLRKCSNLLQFSVTSEKLEILDLEGTAIEEFPPSLGRSKNLWYLVLSGCTRLKDLPDNFFHVGSALFELNLSGSFIETLPESIKFVSQLRDLNVANCKMLRSLPELPQSLLHLDAKGCISLETVSSSVVTARIQNSFSSQNKRVFLKQIQDSYISLEWSPLHYSELFDFSDCTRLDENVCKTIMGEAITRIKHAVYLSSMVQPFIDPYHQFQLLCNTYGPETVKYQCLLDSEWLKFNANCCRACKCSYFAFGAFDLSKGEDASRGLNGRLKICMQKKDYSFKKYGKLWYKNVSVCLPGAEIPSCFRYRTTERTSHVTLQLPLPSHLLGFAFCAILSSDLESGSVKSFLLVECEFDLEETTSYRSYGYGLYEFMGLVSDTIFLWYDAKTSYCLLEDIKERRSIDQCTTYNPKLSFQFYTNHRARSSNGIKECGVWPIYDSDLEIEKEKKKKLKRKRKTSLVFWHCKWQALITRRTKKSKNHRLSKHRNRVQTNVSNTSRKKARISNTSPTEEV